MTAHVVSALETDMICGRLRPRERLVEDTLIERFDVKRHIIRRALGELERKGIVVRVPNRGAQVRDFDAREVAEIVEIRQILQGRAVERMALPADDALIEDLVRLQCVHDEAVERRDPPAIHAANEVFHARFFMASGSNHLIDAIQRYAGLSRAMRFYPLVDAGLQETLRAEHWQIIEALRRSDREALGAVVARHIEHAKGLYLTLHGMGGG